LALEHIYRSLLAATTTGTETTFAHPILVIGMVLRFGCSISLQLELPHSSARRDLRRGREDRDRSVSYELWVGSARLNFFVGDPNTLKSCRRFTGSAI
jgi:hypothetical protein